MEQLRGKFLTVAVNRIVILFFLLCLLTAFLYFLGTGQGFMTSTQYMLLRLTSFFGLFLALSSVFGFIVDFIYFAKKKKIRYLVSMFCYFLSGIIGGTTALTAFFIIIVSAGNSGSAGY